MDIINIDTNTNPDLISNLEAHKQTVSISTQNIFKVVEDAIDNHPTVDKVVLMERTFRSDPCSIKAQLSNYGNAEYDKLLAASKHKDKIVIGKHNKKGPCVSFFC